MRIYTFLLTLFLMLLIPACGNVGPLVPVDYEPVFTVEVPGYGTVTVNLSDMWGRLDRQTAATFEPGTNMTAAELRIYFAVNTVNSIFPTGWWRCIAYNAFKVAFLAMPDSQIYSYVTKTENEYGIDVPNKGPGVPPNPIC